MIYFCAAVGAVVCLALAAAGPLSLLAFGDRLPERWLYAAIPGAYFGGLFLAVAAAATLADLSRLAWAAMKGGG